MVIADLFAISRKRNHRRRFYEVALQSDVDDKYDTPSLTSKQTRDCFRVIYESTWFD